MKSGPDGFTSPYCVTTSSGRSGGKSSTYSNTSSHNRLGTDAAATKALFPGPLMVGRTGIEPVTSCVSSKRSPAELTPLGRHLSRAPGGGERNRTAVQGFAGPCLNHSATPPKRGSSGRAGYRPTLHDSAPHSRHTTEPSTIESRVPPQRGQCCSNSVHPRSRAWHSGHTRICSPAMTPRAHGDAPRTGSVWTFWHRWHGTT